MPVTITYDLQDADGNQRNYIRSMFERFGWQRLGGSVFRYAPVGREEDWLNEVAPSLMFFRSYVNHHGILVRFFTIDTSSVARIDHSDPALLLGLQPTDDAGLPLYTPTNNQSSVSRIRRFIKSTIDIMR